MHGGLVRDFFKPILGLVQDFFYLFGRLNHCFFNLIFFVLVRLVVLACLLELVFALPGQISLRRGYPGEGAC